MTTKKCDPFEILSLNDRPATVDEIKSSTPSDDLLARFAPHEPPENRLLAWHKAAHEAAIPAWLQHIGSDRSAVLLCCPIHIDRALAHLDGHASIVGRDKDENFLKERKIARVKAFERLVEKIISPLECSSKFYTEKHIRSILERAADLFRRASGAPSLSRAEQRRLDTAKELAHARNHRAFFMRPEFRSSLCS